MKQRNFVRLLAVGLAAVWAVSCAASRSCTQSTAETVAEQRIENEYVAGTYDRTKQELSAYEETVSTFEPVPAERVAVEVPLAALDSLPEGARFGARDGRTEVVAMRRGDKLVVEARSDSMARAVVRTARSEELRHSDSTVARVVENRADSSFRGQSSTVEHAARSRPGGHWWLAIGLVLGIVLLVGFRKRRC